MPAPCYLSRGERNDHESPSSLHNRLNLTQSHERSDWSLQRPKRPAKSELRCPHVPPIIRAEHQADEFETGEKTLDDWLKKRALKNRIAGASRYFCAVLEQDRDRLLQPVGEHGWRSDSTDRLLGGTEGSSRPDEDHLPPDVDQRHCGRPGERVSSA